MRLAAYGAPVAPLRPGALKVTRCALFGLSQIDDFRNTPLSLTILQVAGVGETFNSESDLALQSECFVEPDPKLQRPKISQASHSCDLEYQR